MTKIDFKQLAKIERQYAMNNQHVSLNTLQTMVDQVINISYDAFGAKVDVQYSIAYATLKELGIIKEDGKDELDPKAVKPKVQQLNS